MWSSLIMPAWPRVRAGIGGAVSPARVSTQETKKRGCGLWVLVSLGPVHLAVRRLSSSRCQWLAVTGDALGFSDHSLDHYWLRAFHGGHKRIQKWKQVKSLQDLVWWNLISMLLELTGNGPWHEVWLLHSCTALRWGSPSSRDPSENT